MGDKTLDEYTEEMGKQLQIKAENEELKLERTLILAGCAKVAKDLANDFSLSLYRLGQIKMLKKERKVLIKFVKKIAKKAVKKRQRKAIDRYIKRVEKYGKEI
jgi:hypothetical protein